MRLQLTGAAPSAAALVLLSLCLPGPWLGCARRASAQGGEQVARARSSLYQDDDHTTISTSTVAVHATPGEKLRLGARYLVDAISSASIDVVSAATTRWTERRHEAAADVGVELDGLKLGGGYIYSVENDWSSHTASLGASRDFLDHDLTVGASGALVANRIWRRDDETFRRALAVVNGSLYVTATPDPRDLVSVDYTVSVLRGYQASPYRFARFRQAGMTQQLFFARELHPEARLRHALTLRWNRHLGRDTALRPHMRLYADDWGVRSLTAGSELVSGFGAWELGAHVRGYVQRHAAFYRDVYGGLRRYMTSDRELSSFADGFAGAQLARLWGRPGGTFAGRVELRLSGFAFRFWEFSRLPTRYGLVADLGCEVTF